MENKEEYIKDNLDKSTAELAEDLECSKRTVRRIRKKIHDADPNWNQAWLKGEDGTFHVKQERGEDPSDYNQAWLKTKNGTFHVRREVFEKETLVEDFENLRKDFIESVKGYAPVYPKINRTKVLEPHLCIVDIADGHIGKYAPNKYNPDIAVDRIIKGVSGLMDKSSSFELDEIYLIVGNDILHVDNGENTTTRGTRQDTTLIWYEAYQMAKKMYIKIIEYLHSVAPLKVVLNLGNHDAETSYLLADTLYSWFRNTGIYFDVSNQDRKYHAYGNSMLCFTHGDGTNDEKIGYMAAHEEAKLWGSTTHRYAYLHHLHHKKMFKYQSAKDYTGFTAEYTRSPSEPDRWHVKNGYMNLPAAEAFIHSKESGQVARITHSY